MDLFSFYGSLIVFIVLIIYRNKRNLTKDGLHFPFELTYLGDVLYLYLLIFLIVSFVTNLLFIRHIDLLTNHHSYIDNKNKQCCGAFLLFTFGLGFLFISICGVLGSLFFIIGDVYSNGNLYIKTVCLNSDISCYGLFKFSSNFTLDDNIVHPKIFYYIYLKKNQIAIKQKI